MSRSPRCEARGGYTLVELLMSMAAATILMAGLTGALSIAVRSLRVDTLARDESRGAAILAQITSDLRTATDVVYDGASIMFTNVDGKKVEYRWDGSPGNPAPLEQRFDETNGGAWIEILPRVENFALSSPP